MFTGWTKYLFLNDFLPVSVGLYVNTLTSITLKITLFWVVMLCLHPQRRRITMKMEAAGFSKMLVLIYQTALAVYQKTVIFIGTTVRNLSLTLFHLTANIQMWQKKVENSRYSMKLVLFLWWLDYLSSELEISVWLIADGIPFSTFSFVIKCWLQICLHCMKKRKVLYSTSILEWSLI
jgi:hypothetical protein